MCRCVVSVCRVSCRCVVCRVGVSCVVSVCRRKVFFLKIIISKIFLKNVEVGF